MSGIIFLCFTDKETEALGGCDCGRAETELGPLGSFPVLFSVTPVREGLFFGFSVVSFCTTQADGWAFVQSW